MELITHGLILAEEGGGGGREKIGMYQSSQKVHVICTIALATVNAITCI